MDEQAWIYLNGKTAGENTVESTGLSIQELWAKPFKVDVSKVLRLDGENLLTVRVHNKIGMGGIWRPVYLVLSDKPTTLPQQFLAVRVLTKATRAGLPPRGTKTSGRDADKRISNKITGSVQVAVFESKAGMKQVKAVK